MTGSDEDDMTIPTVRCLALRGAKALAAAALLFSAAFPSLAIDAVRGGPLPQPLFPATNWWNLDVSTWPVDANSAAFIAFINNGRKPLVQIKL